MTMLGNLNESAIKLRAMDKINAKMFFANKKLEELYLIKEGVIPSKLDDDLINISITSQMNEIDTLEYIRRILDENK